MGLKLNRRFEPAGAAVATNKINKMFLAACGERLFFVGFNNKIKPRGAKSEATAVIMNWGTLGDSKRMKQKHRFHRGPVRGEALFTGILQFSMLAGDARPEA